MLLHFDHFKKDDEKEMESDRKDPIAACWRGFEETQRGQRNCTQGRTWPKTEKVETQIRRAAMLGKLVMCHNPDEPDSSKNRRIARLISPAVRTGDTDESLRPPFLTITSPNSGQHFIGV